MLEVNSTTKEVFKKAKMPEPKFAHGAVLCCDQIIVTGGISNFMLNMGLRSVPLGEKTCYSFKILDNNRWEQLPDLPVGKMHPTLV